MIQLKVYEDQSFTTQHWIELYDSEPIKLTLSIEDITNADATSTYSRAFKVPGTRKNNEFFKQAFEINGILFDVTIKKPATILVDGAEFRSGHVRLQKIFKNTELDRFDYELVFLGETRDFSSIIGDSAMCSLNMTDIIGGASGAPLTKADIIESWNAYPQTPSLTAGLHNGDIIYPLVDHGNTYDDNGFALESEIRTGVVATKPFTNPSYPLNLNRMFPMIRAKRIWDQIFADAGYTYSSTFIDSSRFKQMYVSAFGNEATVGYDATNSSEYNFSASDVGNANSQGTGYQAATQVVVDPSNLWNGLQYTAPAAGQYTFTGSVYFYGYSEIISSWPPAYQTNFGVLQLLVNGIPVASGAAGSMQVISLTHTLLLNPGDIVQWFIDAPDGDYNVSNNQSFACTSSPGNINPVSLLECTYKQIDFIKDILLMFRLVLSPDPNNPKNFIVEPWQTYINSGQLYDWSHKLVEEKDVVVEPVFFSQSDQITFTQPTDGDWINLYHQQSYKHNWGWLQFDSGNDLLKGTRDVKVTGIANTPFTQVEGQPSTSSWIIPQLHTHTSDNGTKHLPIKPKTRLLFYNGRKTTPQSWYLQDGTPLNEYPLVSQYETFPITAQSLNLAFSNDVKYWGDDVVGYNSNGRTLYDTYWSRYINSLYNKFSRRVTAHFVLNNIDLNTFSFDDTIFVNGVYYIPEKIIDLQIGAYTEVQVQLLTANDYVPTFSNEVLTNVVVTGVNTGCPGQLGSVNVSVGGAGPINWTLSDGQSGQYNNYSPPPYAFTIPNVASGTWTINLTDAIGRTYTGTVTVPVASGPTATSVVTAATPGLCDGSIVVTPTGTAPFTIFWSDQGFAGTFTRNNMCCGAYSYFVRDANGCESPAYLVQVECPPPTYIYEARAYGKSCGTLSSQVIIVESSVPLPLNQGNVYQLNNFSGCYAIITTSTQTPVASVIAEYPNCEVCQNPIEVEYQDWYLFNSGTQNYPVNTTGSAITDAFPNFFLNSSLYDPSTGDYTTTTSVSDAIIDTIANEGINPGAYGGINLDYIQGFSWNNPTHTNTNPSPSTQTNPSSLVGASYNYVIVKQSLFDDHFDAFGSMWQGPYVYNQANTTSIGTENWQDRQSLTLGANDYYILRGAYAIQSNSSTSQYLSYQNPLVPTPTPGPTATPAPTPTAVPPTPTPLAKRYYVVQNCSNPLDQEIIEYTYPLNIGDVYALDSLKGCWSIVEETITSGNFPSPIAAYENCNSCLGLPEGEFISNRKQGTGTYEPICATLHKYPIYCAQASLAQDLQPGYIMYSDPGMQNPYNGQDKWYSIAQDYSTNTQPVVAIQIDTVGGIHNIEYCSLNSCIKYTMGGYDVGYVDYLDCDGLGMSAYYDGPAAGGYSEISFCATQILSWTSNAPHATSTIC